MPSAREAYRPDHRNEDVQYQRHLGLFRGQDRHLSPVGPLLLTDDDVRLVFAVAIQQLRQLLELRVQLGLYVGG